MKCPFTVRCTNLGFVVLACLLFSCATDPGTSTPVSGGAITRFTYETGGMSVYVNIAFPKIYAAAILFDTNPITGQRTQATELDSGVSVIWPDSIQFSLPNCQADPVLDSTDTRTTFKVFNYAYPESCLSPSVNSGTGVATLTVNKTGMAPKTLNGATPGSPAASGYHTVFLTKLTVNGCLGGTSFFGSCTSSGASVGDGYCAMQAALGTVTSSLTGTWRAVLSDDTSAASSRITFASGTALKNTNGQTVLADASTLWSGGSLSAGLLYDEFGNIVNTTGGVEDYAWTASAPNGTNTGTNCHNWSKNNVGSESTTGRWQNTDSNWIQNSFQPDCSQALHLYCINSNN